MQFETGPILRNRHHFDTGIRDSEPSPTRKPARKLAFVIVTGLMLMAGAVVSYAGTPPAQIISADLGKDKTVPLDHPKLIAANDAHFLHPNERLVGVVVDGVAKAYPLRILNWHQVVNDVTSGKPVAVTYCPLTGDAAVYERTIDGKAVTLSPVDKLYESDTLLRDSATHSLWAQATGKAITGPEKGKQLTALASITTVWALWKSFHPKTLVLSTDTGFARHYETDPYVKYELGEAKFPVSKEDQRLPRDEMVLGVDVNHQAEAFPFDRLAVQAPKKAPLNVRLGGRTITIVFDPATGTAGAADEKEHIPAYSGYWFGWAAFHPQSAIWGKPLPKPIGPLPIVFKDAGDLANAREGNSATLLKDGKVLIAGGDSGRSPMIATAELYDPVKHAFTGTGKMVYPRGGHDATRLADGKVLITGGMDERKVIAKAEVYDPATGQFKAVQPMNAAREKHTATLLKDGHVLIAGGFSGDSDPTSSTELYDPATGSFSSGPAMMSGRQNHTATILPDGRVLLTGGIGAKGQALASAEIYDPATGKFTPAGAMNAARQGQTATLLKNGQVLITGGASDGAAALTSAEIYDPATGKFTPVGEMNVGREGHRAVMLGDGDILIVGGLGIDPKHRYLASTELYDPATKKFTLLGEMLLPRFGPTLTLLDNGDVLVTGRFSAPNYFATATAELYQPSAKAKQ